jgi:hypothetical protein
MPAVLWQLPSSTRRGEGELRTDRWMARCTTGRGTTRTAGKTSRHFRARGDLGKAHGFRWRAASEGAAVRHADARRRSAEQRFTVPLFEREKLQNFE